MKFSSLSSLNFTVLLLEVYKTSLLDIIGSRQWKKAHAVSCVSLLFGGFRIYMTGSKNIRMPSHNSTTLLGVRPRASTFSKVYCEVVSRMHAEHWDSSVLAGSVTASQRHSIVTVPHRTGQYGG